MLPTYEENEDRLEVRDRPLIHVAPHLHTSLEVVLVMSGTYTLGCGIDLFPMKEGDLGIVFPGIIHHYHVFDSDRGCARILLAAPSVLAAFSDVLTTKRPADPVITRENVAPDMTYALSRLLALTNENPNPKDTPGRVLFHSFVQILLAEALPKLSLSDRTDEKNQDPVYRAVAYIAAHFQEDISLTGMARDLGISPYQLSRVFSGTFHQNFNHYLNEVRLSYVAAMLRDTDRSITEIAYEAGFQSQATFNRVFQTGFHCSPRQYRMAIRNAPG